ncbi:MAG: hypothetical protein A2148_04085 [Chloroflexi bacterium RBG_16_68_14]|nr:MAG: hypothetical protein A2148_04085 [Chloroflexi bacterium RBG_16_68_14]
MWQRGFYDRMIRDERQLEEAIRYIDENPVSAGLAKTPEEYPFSSAGRPDSVDLREYLGGQPV